MTSFRLIFIFIIVSLTSTSQTDTVYFSTTGDTVLYSYKFFQPDTTFDIFILKKHPIDTVSLLSRFTVKPTKTLRPYTDLSADTLKKYGLTYSAVRIDPYKSKDFSVKIKCSKAKKIEQCSSGEDYLFIYKADMTVTVKCKGQKVYFKTYPFMYKKLNGTDQIDKENIVQLLAWKRGDKYFISCRVRDRQIIKCEGDFFETRDSGHFFIN